LISKPKTVRVRICVVVDDEGRWCSAGWTTDQEPPCDDKDLIAYAMESDITGANDRIYFLEADLPLPEFQTIEATVEEVKEK
jgi:hypothetical protein